MWYLSQCVRRSVTTRPPCSKSEGCVSKFLCWNTVKVLRVRDTHPPLPRFTKRVLRLALRKGCWHGTAGTMRWRVMALGWCGWKVVVWWVMKRGDRDLLSGFITQPVPGRLGGYHLERTGHLYHVIEPAGEACWCFWMIYFLWKMGMQLVCFYTSIYIPS